MPTNTKLFLANLSFPFFLSFFFLIGGILWCFFFFLVGSMYKVILKFFSMYYGIELINKYVDIKGR